MGWRGERSKSFPFFFGGIWEREGEKGKEGITTHNVGYNRLGISKRTENYLKDPWEVRYTGSIWNGKEGSTTAT